VSWSPPTLAPSEHASHVSMSMGRLLSRIFSATENVSHPYQHHPMIPFAMVFASLIHDVEHRGVSNAQLVVEGASLASLYKNRSVAEQNSLDVAWELLLDPTFADLRATIASTQDEQNLFRSLVVHAVMATDIADRPLKEARNERWNRAFSSKASTKDEDNDGNDDDDGDERHNHNLKATIVLEHLIQASDVSHTMQHWNVYRTWNERLFLERMFAYKAGRAPTSPADVWYQGEIGFFDGYVIPLARKLQQCQQAMTTMTMDAAAVEGSNVIEYLHFAIANRDQWKEEGQQVVQEMVEKYKDLEPAPTSTSTITTTSHVRPRAAVKTTMKNYETQT
jgi:hypothetical protein